GGGFFSVKRNSAEDAARVLYPSAPRAIAILALIAILGLLFYGQAIFVTIFFSIFLSLALRPFVSLLERAHLPRVPAILLVLGILVGAVALLIVNISAQLQQFYLALPLYQNKIRDVTTRAADFIRGIQER